MNSEEDGDNPYLYIGPDGKYHITMPEGDSRIARAMSTAEEAYQDAVNWHNARIADGTDPRTGLRSVKYIPWDERIDGVAAMMGAAGYAESSYERNARYMRGYGSAIEEYEYPRREGLSCGCALLIVAVAVSLLIWMATYVP